MDPVCFGLGFNCFKFGSEGQAASALNSDSSLQARLLDNSSPDQPLDSYTHSTAQQLSGGSVLMAMAHSGGASSSGVKQQVKLEKESNLRIEVGNDSPLCLRLLNGNAEIFGTELAPEIWLNFPPRLKFAVFTWYGTTIEMEGTTETDYTADETPMVSYVNVHAILETRRTRDKASSSGDSESSQGPRMIVVGPTDSGKSTLLRIFLSWAAKQGSKPTFVDLDIRQGSIMIPGCNAATPIEMHIDPIDGITLEMPLVYFFGHTTPSNNVELYKVLVKELRGMLERQFAGNTKSRASGIVMNTMGWIEGVGYDLLLHATRTLKANVVLVLGQEKLYSMLIDVLKGEPKVDVVKLQRSGGVLSRNVKVHQKARTFRIREYFYGLLNDLSPHSNIANFSDLCVYRIGGEPQAPRSALPIGAEPVANPTRVVPVSINRDLLHMVLAVSFAKEPEEIISSNVAGFIYVTYIEEYLHF
ncbi:protein CLP1 homolog [Arachis ipaensis]|uniref:protein CLP1 homolog n=1 Tax=Arachis ipaensis TaxID=130454 RepID=UPI000A2B6385|nr:protein CLP1 homolog [Arachis ipaensis]